jgi:multidrug resistance efflux pump
MSDNENAQTEAAPAQEDAPAAVKRGGKFIALLIVLSLAWYLASDRYTPYTSQARVQGYVIGVAPQVSGIVTEVMVRNNERVEADQPLFRIDPSQYEIALAKARSDYDNALSQVGAGDAGVEAARANLRSAQANLVKAQKDTARLSKLYEEDPGTISVRRLEVSRATLEQSLAAVEAARAGIQQAIEAKGGASNDAENTILRVARTGVEKAKLDLEHTVVRATDRGEITDLQVDAGVFAGAGKPVITLVSLTDVWIEADFTENNLGHIGPGSPVEIVFDSLPGRVYEGRITNIGIGVSGNRHPQPGTLPTIDNDRDWLRQSQRFPVLVRFDFQQDEDLLRQLRVGGQASVIAYGEGAWLTKLLGSAYIRVMSFLSYAY